MRSCSSAAGTRRLFLTLAGGTLLAGTSTWLGWRTRRDAVIPEWAPAPAGALRLFLCGDVMTGRAIDQIMPHPAPPELFEPHVKDAREYVELAEKVSGAIPRNIDPSYVWGDALAELDRTNPDARIINLETSITSAGEHWPGKPVHYRMSPANIACLPAARIGCCALANNHVLDWGRIGLTETVASLRSAGIQTAGAGADLSEAEKPAVVECREGRRVLVFAFGSATAGIPGDWSAGPGTPGVQLLDEADPATVDQVSRCISAAKRPGDIAVVSIHWGGNWGYDVPAEQRRLAHDLIDEAGADIVHGHSSHHPRPLELYRGKLILYGCGDFINDYEGIRRRREYRSDIGAMYLPDVDSASGRLLRLALVPIRIRKFQVCRASREESEWLRTTVNRHLAAFGVSLERAEQGFLELAEM